MTQIRAGTESDLPELTALYNHYAVGTHITFDTEPQDVVERREWLAHYATTGRHRLLVAQASGRIVGYATSSRFRAKPGYDTSVETTVYVHPDLTGGGIGRALYDALFSALADEDVHRAYAGIALPNDASVALHVSHGFRHIGTFTEVGHKLGRWWDVAWYERPLP